MREEAQVNPLKEDFNSRKYIAHIHSNIKHTDLQRASINLQQFRQSQTEELKDLVTTNMEHFIKSIDTIDEYFAVSDTLRNNIKNLQSFEGIHRGTLYLHFTS